MRSIRTASTVIGCALTAGLAAAPAAAEPLSFVPCDEWALVTAIEAANAAGGDTLALTPFYTYTLTRAHGGVVAGPTGLPPVTTEINLLGLGVTITRQPGAPAFRVLEVDSAPNVPGTHGRLAMTEATVQGGAAVAPYGGGGIANFGGEVSATAGKVADSTATAGGGIYTDNGRVTLTVTIITGNTATAAGGGVYDNSGPVGVTVTTAGGTNNGLSYTYVDTPAIGTLAPDTGPASGGTAVTITGTNLTTTESVTFGGTSAPFSVINDSTLSAVTPPGTPGPVDVTVTTNGGSATAIGGFTYAAAPGI